MFFNEQGMLNLDEAVMRPAHIQEDYGRWYSY